jgi:hypothetical protein
MFIGVGVREVAPRQGCNVLSRSWTLANLNELAQSGSGTLHPWRGALVNNVPIYKHCTPDWVDAADLFTSSSVGGSLDTAYETMPLPRGGGA